MLGQEKLKSLIDNYSLDTLPHSIIFLGNKGSGKHEIVKYLSLKMNLQSIDITEIISLEYINNIITSAIPNIYIIDSSLLTEKAQNILLKFIEEPPLNAYIVVLCENKNLLLDTIYNRCVCFELEKYTKEQLKTFILDQNNKNNIELSLSICQTPGEILNCNLIDINKLYELCSKIASLLKTASFPNTLTIVNKLNYKDEYDKFDVDLFFKALVKVLAVEYFETKTNYSLYMYTVNQLKLLQDKRLNKQIFVENYLTKA